MNQEQAKYLAPFIKAFGDGKVVQFRYPTNSGGWHTSTGDFNSMNEYRIKPEVKVWYNIIGKAGKIYSNLIGTEGLARADLENANTRGENKPYHIIKCTEEQL